MKLSDYYQLISNIPYLQQAFDIKKNNWNFPQQSHLIQRIFGAQDVITISRKDIYEAAENLEEFVLKTLMWANPTMEGRKNIALILEEPNFQQLLRLLKSYRNRNITCRQLKMDMDQIPGVGLSTFII